MGALHAGHLALIEAARAECDLVVLSLFVNPAQFDQDADLEAYPRDEERDAAIAADAGVDVLFAPDPDEIYWRRAADPRDGLCSAIDLRLRCACCRAATSRSIWRRSAPGLRRR